MARISEVVGYWPFHPSYTSALNSASSTHPSPGALTSAGSTDPPHGALTPTTSLMPGSCQVGPTAPTRRRKVILSTGNIQITRHATHQTVQKHENHEKGIFLSKPCSIGYCTQLIIVLGTRKAMQKNYS